MNQKPIFLDLSGLARRVIIAFVLLIAADAAAVWSGLRTLKFIEETKNGNVDLELAENIDAVEGMMGIAQLIAMLLVIIFFLMWFYRAHKNLGRAGLDGLKYTPGWTIGGFFVPFLNIVRPYQIMKEVWKGSSYLAGVGKADSWQGAQVDFKVGLWWGFFILTSTLGNLSARMSLKAEEIDQIKNATIVTAVSDFIDIPAAIVAILLIVAVTRLQKEDPKRIDDSPSVSQEQVNLFANEEPSTQQEDLSQLPPILK